jgi:exodeoxyribonuclease V gamma subunit
VAGHRLSEGQPSVDQTMSLQIHRAERADRLARELGEILRTPLSDPFATEIVAVPTQGVERWLGQTLSHQLGTSSGGRDGICAGVEFLSPGRLTAAAVAAVMGIDARTDPWHPRRAVWPLLTVIDRARGEKWASLLWSYLGERPERRIESTGSAAELADRDNEDRARSGRRWSTAQHLADLFAGYVSGRPQMILSWLEGHDVDGSGRPLPSDYAWQAELWRRLRHALDTPSPAERGEAACARLVADPEASELPPRLSVFGATRLSPEHRAVLSALAAHRDVHLWLPHPSPALWHRLADRRGAAASPGPRAADRSAELSANPLLAYLGRDVRELQLSLAAIPGAVDVHHAALKASSDHSPTLLQRLQDDLAHDRPARPSGDRPVLDPADHSISLHASHGPDRQVEVLRELLVGLLADDQTLEPRDIVVMCPDIETFAPLISATFGQEFDERGAEHPGHRLRVRLADRALRQINPLLAALGRVLALADSRMEASTLLDLCAFPPVAQKFGFTEDDLERLQDLVRRSGVRWGLEVEHRNSFAMGLFAQNTWAAGLDRLLLGVTMDESGQHFIGTALPLDDVESSDVDLIGRLAELLDRIHALMLEFDARRPLNDWVRLCRQAIEQLTAVPSAESWQVSHAYAELGVLTALPGEDAQTELSLVELRALLSDLFKGRASRANFRTGTLTMCTMMPMRSIPHRVICLLGVDDGVFPRHSSRDGDDILTAEPWVGDRDPRSEDRQLLLDAIMAAEDHLMVIFSGADPRTRAPKPPAVPIGALLDALDLTARAEDGRPVRDHIVTTHSLQPFDPSNFIADRLAPPGSAPFSFDQASLRGAIAASGARVAPAIGFEVAGMDAPPLPEVITLQELIRFFNHPVKALLRARAGLYLGAEEQEPVDQIPVMLKPLEAWAMGDRLLKLHLEGLDVDRLEAAEWRRGSLPPRGFGVRALEPVLDNVRQIADASRPFLVEARTGLDVLASAGAHTVSGTLSTIYGERLVTVNYSRLGPKHRLQAWLELLALTVSHPGRSWQAVTIGRAHRSRLGPVPAEWAAQVLADLVDLFRIGMCEPLPLGPKTAAEYARIRFEGKSISVLRDKLERAWKEERDLAYEKFFGVGATLDDLMRVPSIPAEERGSLAEPSRLGTLARRVWHPLLSSEVLT